MLPRLSGRRLDDYFDALRNSHEIRVRCEVWDYDDNLVKRFDSTELPIVGGQVDVDLDQAIQRQLNIEFARTPETGTEPTDPKSALSADKMLRVEYGVFTDWTDGSESSWVYVPVFHGPITRVKRNDATVSVEAQSKEAFLLPPSRLNRSSIPNEEGEDDHKITSYYAGDLIKSIARRHGERWLRVPRTDRKLPEDHKMFDKATQETGAWPLMQSLAGAQQLFYDASGHLVMRSQRRRSPVYVFNDGENGEVLSVPTIEFDRTLFRNSIELKAFQKKRGKEKENPRLRVVAHLERGHPLSAQSLSRNGEPQELLLVVETENVYANARDATKDAKTMLDRAAYNAIDVQFDALPMPFLEPGDLLALDVKGLPRREFVARKFSLPLTPASMPLGYNRRTR
jgi:hypothetical protein